MLRFAVYVGCKPWGLVRMLASVLRVPTTGGPVQSSRRWRGRCVCSTRPVARVRVLLVPGVHASESYIMYP
eukprot:505837-Alexandrium_andersonii.AAC.1